MLRENIEHMQEEMEGMRVDMGKMELGNQEMLRMN